MLKETFSFWIDGNFLLNNDIEEFELSICQIEKKYTNVTCNIVINKNIQIDMLEELIKFFRKNKIGQDYEYIKLKFFINISVIDKKIIDLIDKYDTYVPELEVICVVMNKEISDDSDKLVEISIILTEKSISYKILIIDTDISQRSLNKALSRRSRFEKELAKSICTQESKYIYAACPKYITADNIGLFLENIPNNEFFYHSDFCGVGELIKLIGLQKLVENKIGENNMVKDGVNSFISYKHSCTCVYGFYDDKLNYNCKDCINNILMGIELIDEKIVRKWVQELYYTITYDNSIKVLEADWDYII